MRLFSLQMRSSKCGLFGWFWPKRAVVPWILDVSGRGKPLTEADKLNMFTHGPVQTLEASAMAISYRWFLSTKARPTPPHPSMFPVCGVKGMKSCRKRGTSCQETQFRLASVLLPTSVTACRKIRKTGRHAYGMAF